MLELDRRIRTGDLAKGSYGNESWQIKKAAVKRHGWGEGEVRTRCVGDQVKTEEWLMLRV